MLTDLGYSTIQLLIIALGYQGFPERKRTAFFVGMCECWRNWEIVFIIDWQINDSEIIQWKDS